MVLYTSYNLLVICCFITEYSVFILVITILIVKQFSGKVHHSIYIMNKSQNMIFFVLITLYACTRGKQSVCMSVVVIVVGTKIVSLDDLGT